MSEARPHELVAKHHWGATWFFCDHCKESRNPGATWDDDCPGAPALPTAQDLFERALRSGGFDQTDGRFRK